MKSIIITITLCFLFGGCDKILLGDEVPVEAARNFKPPVAMADGIGVSSLTKENMDSTMIYEMVKDFQDKFAIGFRSVLIARNDKLVLEAYFNGWNSELKQDIRSATKSFTSALMGIAIDKAIIPGVNEKVFDFFSEYEQINNWDARKSAIQIKDFLRMRTGLTCNDWQGNSSPGYEEKMYKKDDWVKFVLDLPVSEDAGTRFSYCTGAPVTVGAIISNASGKSIPEFADENLFSPLGIQDYQWEFMPNGRADTGGHLHIRPRDMLKFGLLFLNNGKWKGQQIISSSWVAESTQADGNVPGQDDFQYGYLWWCKTWKVNNSPVKSFFANGNGGNLIFVIKDLNMVVVFTGGAYNSNITSKQLAAMNRSILRAVKN